MQSKMLTFYVLDATADDWESLEQILDAVNRYYESTDVLIVAEEIMRLLRAGLFEVMPTKPGSAPDIVAMPIEYWFRMTPVGRLQWEEQAKEVRRKLTDGVRSFVASYTSADEPRIRFAWNGKHAEEFGDANNMFREAVKEFVLSDLDAAPVELVRDLFRAETECSREAWGIGDGVNRLAERLLRSDPERFVEDYLHGKFQSFDSHCGSAFPTDADLAARLLGIVTSRLKEDISEARRQLLKQGESLFQAWLSPV